MGHRKTTSMTHPGFAAEGLVFHNYPPLWIAGSHPRNYTVLRFFSGIFAMPQPHLRDMPVCTVLPRNAQEPGGRQSVKGQ